MDKLFISFQAILPQHLLSRIVGKLASLKNPVWLKNALIKAFIRNYEISLDEAEIGDYTLFEDFNSFFTRALKPGARPQGASKYLQPADGVLSQSGRVDDGQMIQAKGRNYTVQGLLVGSDEEAAKYAEGSFATVYLSPKDYHRVHMPISGTLKEARYVPGDLFAVNTVTVNNVDALFARNERLVCIFDTADGEFAVVLVGAIIVAGIATVWGGRESPDPAEIRITQFDASNAPTLAAGDELGRFFLGSTVVMVGQRNDLNWHNEPGDTVRVKADLAD